LNCKLIDWRKGVRDLIVSRLKIYVFAVFGLAVESQRAMHRVLGGEIPYI